MCRRLLTDERGVALPIALIAMMVLGSLTAALLLSVTVNEQSSAKSAASERAFGLAEEGIAYAEGRIYQTDSTKLTDSSTLPDSNNAYESDGWESGDGWEYWGSFDTTANSWTVTAQGVYGGVTRKVVVQVPITTKTTLTPQSELQLYGYLFANSSASCVTPPVDLAGNGAVTVPIYTNGCVDLQDHTQFDGSDLEVGNYLELGPKAGVGSASQQISTLNVVGGCTGRVSSCGNGNTSPIYAESVGDTLSPPNLTLPTITFDHQYPVCGTGSTGVTASYFDTWTSGSPSTNLASLLFPGYAYDCKIDANDEISWDNSTQSLTVTGGPYYFDGSLSVGTGYNVVYTGAATLFFTGTFNMSGKASICGVTSGPTYCSSQWDPAGTRAGDNNVENELVFTFGCWSDNSGTLIEEATGGTYCVDLTGQNTLQVGTVLNTDYHAGGQATNMGPVIANTISIQGNPGQLIPFSTVPAGAPQTYYTPSTVNAAGTASGWNG